LYHKNLQYLVILQNILIKINNYNNLDYPKHPKLTILIKLKVLLIESYGLSIIVKNFIRKLFFSDAINIMHKNIGLHRQ